MAIVEIPGYGNVEFPDTMSREDMAVAARRLMPEERPPGWGEKQPTEASGTFKSDELHSGIADLLSKIGQYPIGATIGGIAAPAALTIATGGVGLPLAAGAGALGAAGGQALQDYLLKGETSAGDVALQGALGAAGPVAGKALSGLGMAATGLGRATGVLPELVDPAAMAGTASGTGPLQAILQTLQSKVAGGPVLAKSSGAGAQELIDFLAPRAANTELPLAEIQSIRNQVGSVVGKNPEAAGVYSNLMDWLRAMAVQGNQVAANILRNAQEQNVLGAMNPMDFLNPAMLAHRPWAAAARLLAYPARVGGQMIKQGNLNPYLSGAATGGLEGINSYLMGQ